MSVEFSAEDMRATSHLSNRWVQPGSPYPETAKSIVGADFSASARAEIHQWPAYDKTDLLSLDGLAESLGIGAISYKDESTRFGLGSFKALGGAYEVLYALTQEISRQLGKSVTMQDVRGGKYRDVASGITMVSATDGNHGRSVAWGAQNFGCPCLIYVHAEVSQGRCDAIAKFGATVVRIEGDYDDSVRACASDAAENGWHIVSDTSYPGYMELPKQAMAGYSVMIDEVFDQLPEGNPLTHVFVQAGCGGLAAAVLGYIWDKTGADRPRFVIVEPTLAKCLFNASENGPQSVLTIEEESVMAGLSCGEISQLAWQILGPAVDDFILIADGTVAPVMKRLASGDDGDPKIVAGESAVAGLAALIACAQRDDLRKALQLTTNSHALVFGTEGATDAVIYKAMVGCNPEDV